MGPAAIQNDVDFLSRMRLFTGIERSDLGRLATVLRLRKYRKNESIFHEDDPPGSLFLIKKGVVKVQLSSRDGKRITIAWVRPYNFFGTLGCVRNSPRPEAAVALEPVEVLALQREDFHRFLAEHPETAMMMVELLAERWHSALELLQDVAFLDVPARLAKVLLGQTRSARELLETGDGEMESPSQTELAALVGATRESVNKCMQRFVQQGWVECEGHRVRVVDEESLAHLLN